MKTDCIIVDIDGTLSDVSHRTHLVENTPKQWDEFFDRMVDDPVNPWCQHFVNVFFNYSSVKVLLVTGRPRNYEGQTAGWLIKHGIKYDELFMRPVGNCEQDRIIKERILKNDILPKYNVLFCVDDRQQVVDMWRENGLVCLQCACPNGEAVARQFDHKGQDIEIFDDIFREIIIERGRQMAKWGEQNHTLEKWMVILMEEVGEVSRAILEDDDPDHLKRELVQTASVAVAILDYILRQEKDEAEEMGKKPRWAGSEPQEF